MPFRPSPIRGLWTNLRGSAQHHSTSADGVVHSHEVGYETAVTVLKVNEAVEAKTRLTFSQGEFSV